MNFNQYTIKAQEVVQRAVQMAQGKQQQVIETGHILKAILEEDPNTSQFLAKKLNVALPNVNTRLETIINGYPRVAGSANTEYLSNDPHGFTPVKAFQPWPINSSKDTVFSVTLAFDRT